MGDSCAEVSALEGAMEPEAEAMEEVLRAFNRWQQVARSASENRQREIMTKMENLIQQAINAKFEDMEKRLEDKWKIERKKKQVEAAAAKAREKARRHQLVTNRKRPFSAQLSRPVQAGALTASKRPSAIPLDSDSLSTTPSKQRPLQGDSTPTPSVADSPSQPSSSSFTFTMQPSSSTLPQLNNQQTALCKAVKAGRMEDVINYLQFHVDPNFRDEEGDSLLHIAVKNSRLRVLKELFARGAQIHVDAADSAGRTALHVAASHPKGGSYVNILLKQNADVNSRDGKGDTPLHCAARNGYEKIVDKLLGKGASAEIQNNDGRTPIDVATAKVRSILIPDNQNFITRSILPFNCVSTSLSPPHEIKVEDFNDAATEIYLD